MPGRIPASGDVTSGTVVEYTAASSLQMRCVWPVEVVRGLFQAMAEERQPTDPKQLLNIGIQAARAGNKATARAIFQQILDQDRKNERALLWMGSVAETPEERARYLRAVLRINPNNKTARRYLAELETASSAQDRRLVWYGLIAAGVAVLILIVAIIGAVVLVHLL